MKKLTTEEFITKAKLIHGDKYDYSLVDYTHSHTKIKIICPVHGLFEQQPTNHLHGNGCPNCNSSKGEEKIKEILTNNMVLFIRGKTFDDCKGKKRKLPFDFYLSEYNTLIEFQGRQHFEVVNFMGGEDAFKKIQVTDKLKKDYCSLKGIRLLEITYKDDVEKVLNQFLCENWCKPLSQQDLLRSR
jgi:hypothetical protein